MNLTLRQARLLRQMAIDAIDFRRADSLQPDDGGSNSLSDAARARAANRSLMREYRRLSSAAAKALAGAKSRR